MNRAEQFWKEQIGFIGLMFVFYTMTKDLIDEGTVPVISIFFNSKAISAIIYAGILLIFVIVFSMSAYGASLFLRKNKKK
ncbi:MAG: hypothetical protein WCE94_00850 [Candidatus Methanoperedens sp.]